MELLVLRAPLVLLEVSPEQEMVVAQVEAEGEVQGCDASTYLAVEASALLTTS